MSIIGEHKAAVTAARLESILLEAIYGYGDVKSAVMGFSKKHLLEWYLSECEDSYGGAKVNQVIVDAFKEKYGE